ncbi:hypothetical protein JMUB7475_27210 [Staphylococcus aureus]
MLGLQKKAATIDVVVRCVCFVCVLGTEINLDTEAVGRHSEGALAWKAVLGRI